MTIALKPEQERIFQAEIESGRCSSPDEARDHAPAALKEKDNVPVGVRSFLTNREVQTAVEMGWAEQLENGGLLAMAEQAGFDVMATPD